MKNLVTFALLVSVALGAQGTTVLEFIQHVCSVDGPAGSIHFRPLFCILFAEGSESCPAPPKPRGTHICVGTSTIPCSKIGKTCLSRLNFDTGLTERSVCEKGAKGGPAICEGPFVCGTDNRCPKEVLDHNPTAVCRLLLDQ